MWASIMVRANVESVPSTRQAWRGHEEAREGRHEADREETPLDTVTGALLPCACSAPLSDYLDYHRIPRTYLSCRTHSAVRLPPFVHASVPLGAAVVAE